MGASSEAPEQAIAFSLAKAFWGVHLKEHDSKWSGFPFFSVFSVLSGPFGLYCRRSGSSRTGRFFSHHFCIFFACWDGACDLVYWFLSDGADITMIPYAYRLVVGAYEGVTRHFGL